MDPDFKGKEKAAQRDKSNSLKVTEVSDSGMEGNAFPLPYSTSHTGVQHPSRIIQLQSTWYKTRQPLKKSNYGEVAFIKILWYDNWRKQDNHVSTRTAIMQKHLCMWSERKMRKWK